MIYEGFFQLTSTVYIFYLEVANMDFGYESTLKENSDSLSYIENALDDENYLFGDLRDDVDDTVALTVLGTAVYIDEEKQEIGIRDDAFEFSLENESSRRGVAGRPLGLEGAALAGGAAGTVGSIWRFLEDGGAEYLGTGAASALLGRSALKRIGKVFKARTAEDAASKKLDMASHFENYSLKILEPDEARTRLEQKMKQEIEEGFDSDIKAYTAEDLQNMSEEELMEDLEN